VCCPNSHPNSFSYANTHAFSYANTLVYSNSQFYTDCYAYAYFHNNSLTFAN
jgi:hypothetical protein